MSNLKKVRTGTILGFAVVSSFVYMVTHGEPLKPDFSTLGCSTRSAVEQPTQQVRQVSAAIETVALKL